MSDILKLMVPGKPEYVRTVRLAISSIADSAGFDIEEVDDIKVAVSEACSNIVRHGKNNNFYQVVCEIAKDKMVISIEDEAGGYDVTKYKEPVMGDIKEGGLGIFIIKALMDDVDIVSELGAGTSIKMIKKLTSEE